MSDIPVLYEDDEMLAINKPAGLVVHTDGRTVEPSVVDWVREQYPHIEGVGEPFTLLDGTVILRPGIVHRLDRDTSGVLLIAKTAEAFSHLKAQFQSRTISKTYAAFVYGAFKEGEKEGVIDLPIGRSRSDFRKWAAGPAAKDHTRKALTHFTVVEENREAAFLQVEPKTGRTHQIRVHMYAIGHPVVCDSRYAPRRPGILGFERLALHARSITLTSMDGTLHTIDAPLPEDFALALSLIRG